jgi:hypothetical protein
VTKSCVCSRSTRKPTGYKAPGYAFDVTFHHVYPNPFHDARLAVRYESGCASAWSEADREEKQALGNLLGGFPSAHTHSWKWDVEPDTSHAGFVPRD